MNADFYWNPFISAEIERFLTAFQQIEINVAPPDAAERIVVPVHAPYMLQTLAMIDRPEDFAKLKKRHQDRLLRVKAARDNAPDKVKQFLHCQFDRGDGKERHLASGRAELAEIKALLQTAVSQQLIPLPSNQTYLNGRILRDWLKTYGIGVDCSSFVQQALTQALNAGHAAVGEPPAASYEGLEFLKSFRAYREIKNGSAEYRPTFSAVAAPDMARPGDVLVKFGHIRIVIGVETAVDSSLILHLAESTSAPDFPSGQTQAEADIGPRRLQIRYPAPHRAIAAQIPRRTRARDDAFQDDSQETSYLLGRFTALDHFCQTHPRNGGNTDGE